MESDLLSIWCESTFASNLPLKLKNRTDVSPLPPEAHVTTYGLTPVDANRFADDRLSRSYRSNTQQYIRDAISGDHKAPVPLQPRRYLHEGKIRASPCLLLEPSEQTRIFLLVATIADGGNRSFLCRNKTLPV